MSRKIEFALNEDPQLVIKRARQAAEKNGVHLVGDASAGKFTGHGLDGQYAIASGTIAITIRRKPMLVPWSMIESRLQEFFSA
ncbi:MAG: hypothetical protein FIA97_03035 [Methylococcaceae bacterium]|nr:hypothetical protein [Methylococcaceae bacterium]